MDSKLLFRLGIKRFALLLVGSIVLVGIVSELAYQFQKDEFDRAPQVVDLVIPAGAAQDLASGAPQFSFPEELVFIVGDNLVVHNHDDVTHQFGPLVIPGNTNASMVLDNADHTAVGCSFVPSRFMGLDVRAPTDWTTRFIALWLAAPATAAMLFVYSILVFPLQTRNTAKGMISSP
jgi:hypothetical protein